MPHVSHPVPTLVHSSYVSGGPYLSNVRTESCTCLTVWSSRFRLRALSAILTLICKKQLISFSNVSPAAEEHTAHLNALSSLLSLTFVSFAFMTTILFTQHASTRVSSAQTRSEPISGTLFLNTKAIKSRKPKTVRTDISYTSNKAPVRAKSKCEMNVTTPTQRCYPLSRRRRSTKRKVGGQDAFVL